tara:strand:+ start:145 stop:1638 length:1494 start_codon:yes stop_codon:yes gene_type:complete
MFNKILIANRGEIAVRIMRTCREIGIKTVAVFSEPDRDSPHVLKADEAYCIGPAESKKSYLNINSILEVIQKSQAEAVHPGYGFLSENCKFAEQIIKHKIGWIGPSIKSIKIMGDKIEARKLAQKIGVPIIPGSITKLNNLKTAKIDANNIGYPILIKAAGGGGGKGMRIINSEKDLKDAIIRAKSEATKAFSDERVYFEKFLEEPHHIEIQILSDSHGNIVSLFERECSIQRRYQKIIEETPSPFINNKIRTELSNMATKIAKSCNYSGVGTVEFLVDKNKNYYFLEMNTRIQVEHPITEMVTGIDLIKEQIHIAYNDKLKLKQSDIKSNGHAIECRIYAEDGFNNFRPSTGIIKNISFPNGLGVRMDEGIRIGQEITPYYDPLLGKLISWGDSRKIALSRMVRALKEFHIDGIETNIPFCLSIFENKILKTGHYSTDTLNSIMEELINSNNRKYNLPVRIAAIQIHKNSKKYLFENKHNSKSSNWKESGKREQVR